MTVGGSIIMPIDMVSVATIRSMTRNGSTTRNPISKPRLSSEIMNAGMRTLQLDFPLGPFRRLGREALGRQILEQLEILRPHVGAHELAQRLSDLRIGLLLRNLVFDERLEPVLPGFVERRRHDVEGHEQREADEDEIGGRRLQPHSGPEQRQHDHEAREARHHHEQARRHRQHGDDQDDLHHTAADRRLAGRQQRVEIDPLRGRDRRADDERKRGSTARGRPVGSFDDDPVNDDLFDVFAPAQAGALVQILAQVLESASALELGQRRGLEIAGDVLGDFSDERLDLLELAGRRRATPRCASRTTWALPDWR